MSPETREPSRHRRVLEELVVMAGFLVGACFFTYPLVLGLSNYVTDLADPLLNSWSLAWVIHQLPRGPLHLFNANIFHPELGTLAFSEHLLGIALLVAPVQLIWGQAVTSHNVALLLCIALSGYGLYRLVRWLTGSRDAALVAGCMFAYMPYRLGHLSHLQLQAAGFIPLVFLCLGRYLEDARPRHAFGLAVFLWLTCASCGYYGVFTWIILAVAVPYEIVRTRADRRPRCLVGLGMALSLCALAYLPLALPYVRLGQDFGFHRPLERVERASARPHSYLRSHAPLHHRLGLLTANAEQSLFPGVALASTGFFGLLLPNRRAGLYVLMGVFAAWASLGPKAGLYAWLHGLIPGVSGLRVPARFSILVFLALSVLAGFAVGFLLSKLPKGGGVAMVAVLAMAPLLESVGRPLHLQSAPVDAPESVRWLASHDETTPTVELPMYGAGGRRHQNATYMLWSTGHFQPIANGYSGLFPPSFFELAEALEEIPSRESIEMLRRRGIRYVILHRDLYLRERARRLEEALDGEPDLKEVFTCERAVVYEVLAR